MRTAVAARSHLVTHILPVLRGIPMAQVTPEDLERIVDAAAPWVRRLTGVVVWETEPATAGG